MKRTEIAFRYARALFRLAVSEKKVETWLNELDGVSQQLNKNPSFLQIIASPQIDQNKKEELITRCFGKKLDQTVLNFLNLLLKKYRLEFLPDIIKEYRRMAAEELGFLTVHLTTAEPIDAQTEENWRKKIEEKFRKKIVIKKEIDPSLIAGGLLTIGSQRIDSSFRGRLMKLKNYLLKEVS